ncbi:MAG: hypothetical protein K5931_11325, partial [Lachnospiraceae bacterium]|nr:hypothetical protein [Lachnospiraceae bacterium]
MKKNSFKSLVACLLCLSLTIEPSGVMAAIVAGAEESDKEQLSVSEEAHIDLSSLSVDEEGQERNSAYPIGEIPDNRELIEGNPLYEDSLALTDSVDLPEKYNALETDEQGALINLDEIKYVTPIKDQKKSNLCWAYAAMAAFESTLWKEHSSIGTGGDTYKAAGETVPDLSVKSFAYNTSHKARGNNLTDAQRNNYISYEDLSSKGESYTDSLPSLNEYYREKGDELNIDNVYLNSGESVHHIGEGLLSDKKITELSKAEEDKADFIRGGFSEKIENDPLVFYTKSEGEEPPSDLTSYYEEGEQKYQINNFNYISFIKADKDIERIKKLLLENGGLLLGYRAEKTLTPIEGDPYGLEGKVILSANDACFYAPNKGSLNHFVELVGWDDSIKKDSFKSYSSDSYTLENITVDEKTVNNVRVLKDGAEPVCPEGDGAFIIKNSWGSDSGLSGYAYLSYYDMTTKVVANMDTSLKGDEETSLSNEYSWHDNSYKCYSGISPLTLETTFTLKEDLMAGALYTAKSSAGADEITGVNISSLSMGSAFRVSIYKNGKKNIRNGYLKEEDLIASQNAVFDKAGYNTIYFDSPVTVNKGDSFFIKLESSLSDDTPASARSIGIKETDETMSDKGYRKMTVKDESGKSYYVASQMSHSTIDNPMYTIDSSGYITQDEEHELQMMVYTNDRDPVFSFEFTEDAPLNIRWENDAELDYKDHLSFIYYDEELNKVIVKGNAISSLGELSFESSDPSVIAISEEGIARVKNPGRSTIRASLSYEADGSRTVYSDLINVTVYSDNTFAADGSITLKKSEFDYRGEEIRPLVTVKVFDHLLRKGVDYSLSYFDNTEVGEGKVKVTLMESSVYYDKNNASNNEKTASFIINSKSISDSDITLSGIETSYKKDEAPDFRDSSSPLKLTYKFSDDLGDYETLSEDHKTETVLIRDRDYDLSYNGSDISSEGIKYVTIKGKGAYKGSIGFCYEVIDTSKDPSRDEDTTGVYVSNISPGLVCFDGNRHVLKTTGDKKKGFSYDLSLTVKRGDYLLSEGNDYTVSYYNNVNASINNEAKSLKPYLLIKGKGEFAGLNVKRYFEIKPVELKESELAFEGINSVYNVKRGQNVKLKPSKITWLSENSEIKTLKTGVKGSKGIDCYLKYYSYDPIEGKTEELKEAAYNNTITLTKDIQYIYILPEGVGNYEGVGFEEGEDISKAANALKVTLSDSSYYIGSDALSISCKSDLSLSASKQSISLEELLIEVYCKSGKNKEKIDTDISDEGNENYNKASLTVLDPDGKRVEDGILDTAGSYEILVDINGYKLSDNSALKTVYGSVKKSVKVGGLKLDSKKLEFIDKRGKKYASSSKLDYNGTSLELTPIYDGLIDGSEALISYDKDASILMDNKEAGSYSLNVKGQGIYGGSSATMKLVRNKKSLADAIENGELSIKSEDADLKLNVSGTRFGKGKLLIQTKRGNKITTDTLYNYEGRAAGLEFTLKNNIKSGKGDLLIKATKLSNYTGSYTIKEFV